MTEEKPAKGGKSGSGGKSPARLLSFPLLMVVVYGILALLAPGSAWAALVASGRVLLQIAPALVVAFGVIVVLNMLVRPVHIRRFLGRGTKAKAFLLSSVAGILSMGPIYAWYPLLKELRNKGVSDSHLANFLGCRSVKIPLMPLMAAYFGLTFTVVVSIAVIVGAFVTGLVVAAVTGSKKTSSSDRTNMVSGENP
ncbi:MAG: permease [Planctomycetota bacterium]